MRRPGLAIAFAVFAAFYGVACAVFYWDGFFRYWSNGPELWTTDIALPMGGDHYSVVPLSRFLVFGSTLGPLVWCSLAFWRGDARARLVGFFLCFGWLAPQARYLEVYLHDFRSFSHGEAWLVAAALVIVPATLLSTPQMVRAFAPHERELMWAKLPWGRRRLVGLGVLLAWSFYGADIYLADWPWIPSNAGLVCAVAVAALSIVSLVGLLRLKTWSILGALLSSVLTGGFMVAARSAAMEQERLEPSSWVFSAPALLLAAAPLVLVTALTWPILAAVGRKLRA